MELVDALARTFQHTQGIIDGVRADQLDDPTPCEAWRVHDLLEHMISVVAGLGSAAAGRPPEPFELGRDPGAQFDAAATAALDAWRAPGTMERIIEAGPGPMPGQVLAGINLLDTATHAWDLATATGQPAELPDDVALAALDASRTIISADIRPGRFADEREAPDDATATAQLVAFLGRPP